jgi:hypothetical protein
MWGFESHYDRIERQNIFRETTKSNTFESYYDRIESILNVNKCLLAILLFLSEEEKAGKTITYSLTPRGRKAFT